MGEFFKLIVGIIVALGVSKSYASEFIFMDFDDTIVETRRLYGGTFQSHFTLYKINASSPNQSLATGPDSVLVTQDELRQIYDGLAKSVQGRDVPGSLKSFQLKSGQKIVIGEYSLAPERSYAEFREGKNRNYLLETFLEAEKSDFSAGWKGPMWDVMVDLLSDSEKSKTFGIITSRGHSRQEWLEFFEYLRARGYIKHLPNLNQVFSVSRHDFKNYGSTSDHRKANLLAQLAQHSIGKLPLKAGEQSHTLLYAENSSESLARTIEELSKLATLRASKYPVRFFISNTGYKKTRKKMGVGAFAEILPSGDLRTINAEDLAKLISSVNRYKEPQAKNSKNYLNNICVGLFL